MPSMFMVCLHYRKPGKGIVTYHEFTKNSFPRQTLSPLEGYLEYPLEVLAKKPSKFCMFRYIRIA